jgi:hypothetical protein
MGDEPAPRPMANMLNAATNGQTSVQMTPEDFIYLERDCQFFKIRLCGFKVARRKSLSRITGAWGKPTMT